MRPSLVIALVVVVMGAFVMGCKKEEPEAKTTPPPPDPGWPTASVQDAAADFDLEESHYHIRKARYTDPGSFGAETEMPIAMGLTQWAYQMQPDSDAAMGAADHLVMEKGASLDAPYGYTVRCRFCGAPMPSAITTWSTEDNSARPGQRTKIVECPHCNARDPYPAGLVLTCPVCADVVAGTAAAGNLCTRCGRSWKGLLKVCSNCGLYVSKMNRQGQHCPRCKAQWNFDVPFGNWPTRARTGVSFTGKHPLEGQVCSVYLRMTPEGPRYYTLWGEPQSRRCEGYTEETGRRCPNMTTRPADASGKVYCWVHRHQADRDTTAATPVSAGGGAAGGAGGAAGGMGGMPGGMGGSMGAGMPGGMSGGMGGGMSPGGGAPGGGASGGGAAKGGSSKDSEDSGSKKASSKSSGGED
jgi:hypothetical protein